MFGDCINEQVETCSLDLQCNDGSDCTDDYCSNFKCIHIDKTEQSITKLCSDGEIIDFDCATIDDCQQNTFDPCQKTNSSGCNNAKCVYWNHFALNGNACNENMICSYGLCIDEITCNENSDCENLLSPSCISAYSSATCNNNFCIFEHIDNKHRASCTTDTINFGICNHGICKPIFECSISSDCDDENPCTQNKCIDYVCNYNTLFSNGYECPLGSNQGYCDNGTCVSGECNNNNDCPQNTFCRSNTCNLETFTCESTPLQTGAFCNPNGFGYSLFTCNSGECGFNITDTGLCNSNITSTDKIHAIIVMQPARELNNNQNVLAIAGKFDNLFPPNYGGSHVCAGADYFFDSSNNILFPIYGNDYSSPEKDGFNYGEIINLYIRTENYVCKVLANYDTSLYTSTNKWYPIGISQIIKFKDIGTLSTTIDFSNTDYCTLID